MKSIPKTATRETIIELLMDHWDMPSKAELAEHVEVSRHSLGNYVRRDSPPDININIILELMRDVEYLEGKKSTKESQVTITRNGKTETFNIFEGNLEHVHHVLLDWGEVI